MKLNRRLFATALLALLAFSPSSEAYDAHRALRFNTGGSAPLSTPSDLYAGGRAGDYWEVADLTKLFQISDGTTPVTVADDPVGYMGGQRGLHNFTQATVGLRPLYKGSGATANLAFDDTDDIFPVASSAALFKYLHDGTGGSVWAIGQGPAAEQKYFIGTKAGTTTAVGSLLYRLHTTSRPVYDVSNGAATVMAMTASSGTPWPADTVVMVLATYSTADGGRLYVNGVQVGTATESAAPSSSNAAVGLALAPTAVRGPLDLRAVGVIDRVLTPAEVVFLYQYYDVTKGAF